MSQIYSLFDPNATLLSDKKSVFLVKDILADANGVFSKISARALVLLLCRNTVNCVSLYINCIERKVIPILTDADSDIELINGLIEKYKPEFIFLPNDKELAKSDALCSKYQKKFRHYDFSCNQSSTKFVLA